MFTMDIYIRQFYSLYLLVNHACVYCKCVYMYIFIILLEKPIHPNNTKYFFVL